MGRSMMVSCAVAALVAVSFGDVFSDWPAGKDPETVGRKVSAKLLEGSLDHYRPKGFSSEDYDHGKFVPYAICSYWVNAVEFAREIGDTALRDRLSAQFEPFHGEKWNRWSKDDHVDHAIFGAVALEHAIVTGNERSIAYGLKYADTQWAKPVDFPLPDPEYLLPYAERLKLWEQGYSPQTRFWIDDMYMLPFLQVQAYRFTHNRSYLIKTAKEMCLYLDRLQRKDGLFDHGTGAPFAWGRGNGWIAAGMALLLEQMDADDDRYNDYRTRIADGYRKMMATLLKHQRADGLWGQLIDGPDTWAESSGTAMFAYAFVEGVAAGVLDAETYGAAARKAYLALVDRIDADGNLKGTCIGTSKSAVRQDHLDRPVRTGDPHGQAPMMWLVTALLAADPVGGDLHLIGDSTLAVHAEPTFYGSYGQELLPMFKRGHKIVPHAVGGYAAPQFVRNKWEVALKTMKAGDFALVAFGHNDQDPKQESAPEGGYREALKRFAADANAKGVRLTFATPIVRRVYDFADTKLVDNGLRDYAESMLKTAKELGVPCVDMNKLTHDEVSERGAERSASYYMMSAPDGKHPNDRTHPTKIGARRFAELFRDAARAQKLPIAKLFKVEDRPPTEVVFFFDSEDFISNEGNDPVRDMAKLFAEEGIKGHFAIVGLQARQWISWGRTDILEALKPHLVGTQSFSHSMHPDLCEISDLEDFDAAYKALVLQEARGYGMVEAVTGKKLLCAVPPGNSKSYVAMYIYADLGIPFYCDTVISDALHYGDLWYANMRHIGYSYTMERLIPSWEKNSPWKTDWDERFDEWARRPRILLYNHPHTANSNGFWDSPNFRGGNLTKPFERKLVPRRDPEETKVYYERLRAFLRRIKADPRYRITDIEEFVARQKNRVPITAKEIPAIRAALSKRLTCIDVPASWSVADCFQAAVRLLRGETEYRPDKVRGFLSKPEGVTAETTVSRADLVAAAKKIDLAKFLPHRIAVGNQTIGPADFLFAALETLETGAETVTVVPRDQLGPYGTPHGGLGGLAKFSMVKPDRWIHTPEFKDAYLSDRLRWQLWTLRHE